MKTQPAEPIAIVGSGCRFPGGASSPSALWQLLKQPGDVRQRIPPERFDLAGFFHPDSAHHGTGNIQHAYLLQQDELRGFDAQFFFISPAEADSMDPQQRLLLETVYEALEAGGQSLDALRGSDTAVYVGTMSVDWTDMLFRDLNSIPTYTATGTNRAIISNRVSYVFDWHGPSMTIDTACSSSLVAVHQGVHALRSRESRVAVACGTQVILGPETFIIESKMKMLSPTGRSRMWDADADGYARGEGVAALVMKRLSDAIADGDHIQCIIRETSTNQDGYSNGLTVPSWEAQAALIRKTYANAGLDLTNPRDRPQYFEAHGTGTKAGDPKEARAISECFSNNGAAGANPLYVGSIKTVIGHTEGAAGLAGLLKGVASIQAGVIAPNLHFDTLNPTIEQFYRGLQVPTSLTQWPQLPEGVPRRVSVNSFGFGGSNAHVVLEQYMEVPSPHAKIEADHGQDAAVFTPLIFSAASEPSLVAQLQAYSDHLKTHQDIKLADLAWTLHARRTQFPVKVAFAASSTAELVHKIDEKLAAFKQDSSKNNVGTRSSVNRSKTSILGVFTGQGAQWAGMGASLIQASPGLVSKRIQDLEQALATLPAADKPKWSLRDEMLAASDTSRIGEAALSQPLCTALQIILVDLLRTAGINFSAVVGHSSGEIAAAYAAGFLSDRDAIRVAYYRGLYAHLAGTDETKVKESGAMLAAGISWEDAQSFVNRPEFKGRLVAAAHNSSASVTLSGDVEAATLAKDMLEGEKKFARMLKVDTAYHSHHMLPCGEPYVAALRTCGVKVRHDLERNSDCEWFSSVTPSAHGIQPESDLQDVYWRDNMTKPVLFAPAVKNAVTSIPNLSLAIEVGPHPALKGPATQNIEDAREAGTSALPYIGVLKRGQNDTQAFAEALGLIWTQLGAQSIDFEAYHRAVFAPAGGPTPQPKLVTGLPTYQWNHTRAHWHESRLSYKMRTRKQPIHELLGTLSPESTSQDLRWNNVLKVSEIPWLQGHQLQGQIIFPAAGYVAMALEATCHLAGGASGGGKAEVQLFELHDLTIPRAIAFEDGDNAGIETLITLTGVRHKGSDTLEADFSCYSCPTGTGPNSASAASQMDVMAKCTVRAILGTPSVTALSAPPAPDTSNMGDVDAERLYSSLLELGYGYYDEFRTMSAAKRRLNQSTALISTYKYGEGSNDVHMVHPSMLDVAFQAAILAYSAPGDGRLWSLHVPTAIGLIRVNPALCAALPPSGTNVPVWSNITTDGGESFEAFSASIDVLGHDSSGRSMIQVEDLIIKPFAPPTAADDRCLFTTTKWHVAEPDGAAAVQGMRPPQAQVDLAQVCERVAFYYLGKWKAELTSEDWANGQPHHLSLRDYVNHTLGRVADGQNPTIKQEWSSDTPEVIAGLIARYPDIVDLQLISAVGENMVATIRGETTILEHMAVNNMLEDYYANGVGLAPLNTAVAAMVKQITHRYPHARFLEVGAGTGGATKSILSAIGTAVSSYTYTDVSAGFFETAAEVFEGYSDKMVFKTLDAERSPASQGFDLQRYDVIVASNVLHATSVLQRTLENVRQLLRPGGWLVLAELTDKNPVRFNEIMGGLPGWWAGVNDGRKYSPTLTPREWHSILRKAGFGGVDAVTPALDAHATWPFSIIAAQAVDERIDLLRRPLLAASSPLSAPMYHESIVIMGGSRSLESSKIVEELTEYLSRFSQRIVTLDSLPTEEEAERLEPMSTFINLVDLDEPIFKQMTEAKMKGLQRVFELARHMLWVTQGAVSADNAYHMASVAFRRALENEAAHIGLHHLDLADRKTLDTNVSKAIAEHLLRQTALDEWGRESESGSNAQASTQSSKSRIQRQGFLWSKEPEACLDSRGRVLIPRLLPQAAQNDRVNSDRRVITRSLTSIPGAGLDNVSLQLHRNAPPSLVVTGPEQHEQVHVGFDVEGEKDDDSKVRVEGSSLMALSVAELGFLFVGVGRTVATGTRVIFLSKTNSSVTVPVASVALNSVSDVDDAAQVLIAVASELLASSIIQTVTRTAKGNASSILVNSVSPKEDRFIAAALKKQAEALGIRVVFVTSFDVVGDELELQAQLGQGQGRGVGPQWVRLDARAPKHAILKSIRRHVTLANPISTSTVTWPTHFLDIATAARRESPAHEEWSSKLARLLTLGGVKPIEITTDHLTSLVAQSIVLPRVLAAHLSDAVNNAMQAPGLEPSPAADDMIVPLDRVHHNKNLRQPSLTSVVRWSQGLENLKVDISPLDARSLFSRNKSYLLFGLTGEIGRSLCEWMVANGAGCVCLASRSPKANEKWLQSFEGTGATVKLYAADLLDKASLASAVADIRATCPPLGGVANGAMVLRDALFSAMSVDMMQVVLAPKIEGSNNLDEIFFNEPLDFFLLFSSSTALIGNPGQSSYVAANAYMQGLVRQRRKRGLAASAVDIGRVAGLGYVETAGDKVINQLVSMGLMPISETDLHHIFAETIRAGYPGSRLLEKEDEAGGIYSGFEAVVTTGLRAINDDEAVRGPWFKNPLFSHCIVETNGLGDVARAGQGDNKTTNNLPVRDQLAVASNQQQALELMVSCFAAKLCSILQLASDTLQHDAPLVELGMDSLVAVEARSWFLKELKTDIPVLKLVGGASLIDICQLALTNLPEGFFIATNGAEITPEKPVEPVVPHKARSTISTTVDVSTPDSRSPPASGSPTSTVSATTLESLPQSAVSSAKPGLTSTPQPSFDSCIKSGPISIAQSRFWFLDFLLEDPTTFNITLKYRMAGEVRVGDLQRAVQTVVARHESLRTCFVGEDNQEEQALQKVLARSSVKLEHVHIHSMEEAHEEYEKLRTHKFDLAIGPLLRIRLLTLTPNSHYLLINAHHIIMDVTSFQVILSDIEKVYEGKYLGPRPLQYLEFSALQRQDIEEGRLSKELKYWHDAFPASDPPSVLPMLPMARSSSRTAVMTDYKTHQIFARIEPGLVARIKLVAKAQRSTPFHFYLAAFKAMLFSFTNTRDLTIGVADANRHDSGLVGSVGCFMNLLPLRFHRRPDQSFSDAVAEARTTAHAALEHSRLPFDILLEELKVERSSSYNPLFQAFFDYRQGARSGTEWCQCQLDMDDYHPGRTGYDISLDVADISPEAQIALRVQKCFYDLTAAKLLFETYTHFLDTLARDPSLTLQNTPLFSKEQLARAVKIGRGPEPTANWPDTLPLRIDSIAQANPDKPALKDGLGSCLTYGNMINRVESIAEALLKRGIGPASRVLVFQQASVDWICSMLAIMRIGGVYVPTDLRNPLSRIAALSEDCQPSAVLADSTTIDDTPQLKVPVVVDVSRLAPSPETSIKNVSRAESPAAILYTSGSTGKPKGIIIRHSGIRNEMEGYTKTYGLGAERVLQQSAFTFDFSMDQMFTGLVNGGMVYVVPWDKRGDAASITEIIRLETITYTKVTPSEYSMWMECGYDNLKNASSWRFAFAGGEPLTNQQLLQFSQLGLQQLRLFNSYGPAEISIASHKGFVDYRQEQSEDDGMVPCGSSLPGYATYILDANLKPLPAGMPGEVVIAGAGVSLGYLTDKKRTADVFLSNPYATPEDAAKGWTRMHRTGDVGHLQDDGTLVFRHRIAGDTQVKLRGLRIDLLDIETNLVAASEGVLQRAVVTLRDGDPDYLVAHVMFATHHNIDDREAFLEHLLARLPIPQYMVPVLAIPMDTIPLTNHAKIDRKAIRDLPLPQRATADNQNDEELTETMIQLRRLWRQVLGSNTEKLGLAINPATSFFSIGGNSLLVVRLQTRIRQVFDVSLRLIDLLGANTLVQMAHKVEESATMGVIDWEEETKPPSVPTFESNGTNELKAGPKIVLVTGATGYLARCILPRLAADPHVGKIHCIAIRDKPSERPRTLFASDKIVRHEGDLSAPRLGLTVEAFQALSREADVVLHLGAVRAFWDNYHVLRPSNVQPTSTLVELASHRRVPVHFVSTSAVLPQDILAIATDAASAANYTPPADGSGGYIASKWASERLLERSATALGVPSFIYRLLPPRGPKQAVKHEVLDEFVRCVDLAGALPDYQSWAGHINLIPGDQVARWLGEAVVSSTSSGDWEKRPAVFRHLESSITVNVDELRIYLEGKRGNQSGSLHRLPMLKWMGRIKAVGFSFVIASLELNFGEGIEKLKLRR